MGWSGAYEERSHVIQTLMEMDCIPAGMELFPALDEEQFEFIKKVIDDCDYYLLILGGRYGSLSDKGISYTEMEYDYAVNKGMKVIAIVHENPTQLIGEKIELDQKKRKKLEAFRDKVKTNRLVKFWNNADQLAGLVALSLSKTIKTYPAIGWVRGDNIEADGDLLQQLNNLHIENTSLREKLQQLEIVNSSIKFAKGNSTITLTVEFIESDNEFLNFYDVNISWDEIFKIIAERILTIVTANSINTKLAKALLIQNGIVFNKANISESDFTKIKIQFLAHEWINVTRKAALEYWEITEKGKQYLFSIMAVKSES